MSGTEGDNPGRTLLTFSGSATIQVEPDRLELRISVGAQDRRRERAYDQMAQGSQRLGKVLDSLEVPKRARLTDRIVVQDRITKEGRPEGHRAMSTMRLRLPADFPIATLLSRAIDEAGATVEGPMWDLSHQHPSRLEAVQSAVLDAKARATAAATALGIELGPPIEVRDNRTAVPALLPARALAARAANVEVAAGEISVSATVEVTFECPRKPTQ